MNRTTKKLFAITLLLLSNYSYSAGDDSDLDMLQAKAQKNEWILIRNDDLHNIKAWFKIEDKKRVRSFRLETNLDVPLAKIAMSIADADNLKRFFWECLDSKMLKIISPTEYIFYLQVNVPQPVSDRDIVLQGTIEPYSKKRGYLLFQFNAAPNFIPPVTGFFRVPDYNFYVKLTPIDENTVHYEMEGYVDPGEKLPAWAINFIMKNAPYVSVLGMQRYAKTKEFPNPFPLKITE